MERKRFKFSDPLNEGDTSDVTVGCRAFNPDYCNDFGSEGCALTNSSGKCMCPRTGWKKQFKVLSEKGRSK